MAKVADELPIDRYNREIKELWAKAARMSELSTQELLDTTIAFAARILGATFNPRHAKDGDSEWSNEMANRMLLRLKSEIALRFRQVNQ